MDRSFLHASSSLAFHDIPHLHNGPLPRPVRLPSLVACSFLVVGLCKTVQRLENLYLDQ